MTEQLNEKQIKGNSMTDIINDVNLTAVWKKDRRTCD